MPRHFLSMMATAFAMCLAASSAQAQGRGNEDIPPGLQVLTITTCTTSSSPAITTTWRSYTVVKENEQLEQEIQELRKYVLIERYLEGGDIGLRQAASLGSGPELDDLAAIMGVPRAQRAVWRRRVRAEYATLSEILAQPDPSSRAVAVHHLLALAMPPASPASQQANLAQGGQP